MVDSQWHGNKSRKIDKRIVITGTMTLKTPAHFGGGEQDIAGTLTLVRDEVEPNCPLLVGSSIAGALRSYLAAYLNVDDKKQRYEALITALFGGAKRDAKGDQSALIVDDARGKPANVIYRDGVAIDSTSRTAADGALYETQLWDAGTTFPLRFELLLCDGLKEKEAMLKQSLATCLHALATGEIPLGMKKNRGFGQVNVSNWKVQTFDLKQTTDLVAWVTDPCRHPASEGDDIGKVLGVEKLPSNERNVLTIDAKFVLDGSLLIRTADTIADHRTLTRGDKPVLSGTSLAGALRARAVRIVKTLRRSDVSAEDIIGPVFGSALTTTDKKRKASRLRVSETTIDNGVFGVVQSRVSIDRFTGGALDTALFNQRPVFGTDQTRVYVQLHLKAPRDHEIGLLLLLLKDLWTGNLPLGGEQSVGRGRLKGISACIAHGNKTFDITDIDGSLHVNNAAALEQYVEAFISKLPQETNHV